MSKQLTDTAIIIENDSWKVKVYLGLGGLITLVILGFLYRIEAGIIALAIGLAYAGRVAVAANHRHKLAQFERRKLEAETAKLESEAVQARAKTHFVETNSGVFVLEGIAVAAFYPAVSASKLLADVPQLALPEPEAPKLRRLLDVDYIHMLIIGPTNSGKTTVANWLIDNEAPDSICYVLDPHNKFNVWPARVSEVIGTGRNYPAIDAKLLELIGEMDRRYNSDSLRFSRILIVCDEWLSVMSNCPHAKQFFDTIGSEARKVNMSLIISTTSATADDLSCTAATRDNLVQLTLNRTLKDKNQGELKWSRKDVETVILPGPYIQRATALPAPPPPPVELDLIGFDAGPVAPMPDPTELKIFELYQQGKSLRAIYAEVYGKPYTGGRQVAELRAILGKFGVTFDVSE